MEPDGKLRIGVELDTKDFDKEVKQLDKTKTNKVPMEIEIKNPKQEIEKIKHELKDIDAPKVEFVTDEQLKNKEIQDARNKLEEMVSSYKELKKYDVMDEKDIETIKTTKQEIIQARQELEKMTGQKIRIPIIDSEDNNTRVINNMKKGFNDLHRSAKRLIGGIVGVRAAYGLVRKMASAYLESDEKSTRQLQANWIGLGTVMEGVITGVVRLLKTVTTAVLYFASCLTGVNYIAKANAALLRKQKKETAGLRKEQEKLTASFDEMEVLQDSSSSSETSGMPDFELFDENDLGKAKGIIETIAKVLKPVYEMIKGIIEWAAKNPDAIPWILGGLAAVGIMKKLIGIGKKAGGGSGLLGVLSSLKAIAAIGAITITIALASKIHEESQKLAEDIEKIRNDGNNMHKDFLQNEKDINKIIDNSNIKRKAGLDMINQQNWLLGILTKDTLQETLKTIEDISREVGENIDQEIELYKAGGYNKEMQEKIKKEIYDQYLYNLDVIDTLKKRGVNTQGIEQLNQHLIEQYQAMGGKIQEANGKIVLLKDNSNITVELDVITRKAEKALSGFSEVILEPFRALGDSFKYLFGVSKKTKGGGGVRFAKGGIINRPGRGVPLTNAIGGESGAEGVIPLTDSQQMALLGEAIGKHITVNANITNTMNGRVMSRELVKVDNTNNFASNR